MKNQGKRLPMIFPQAESARLQPREEVLETENYRVEKGGDFRACFPFSLG